MTEGTDDTTETEVETENTRRPDGGRDGTDEDDPLGDLARRVQAKRQNQPGDDRDGGVSGPRDAPIEGSADRADVEDSAGGELFDEMDVSDVDTDAVWDAALTDEAEDAGSDLVSSTVGIDPAVNVESPVGEDHIVPKDDYCESCQYFSAPPEVTCSYEDAAIVEVLEDGQFRVRNCPVVEGFVNTDGAAVERDADESVAEETPSD